MTQGAFGRDVAALQFLLWRRGFSPGGIDLVFGPATGAAVASFQRATGLDVDGAAGPATIAALRHGSRSPAPGPRSSVRFTGRFPAASAIASARRARGGRAHAGTDFPVPRGTTVQAGAVGTTIFAGHNSGGPLTGLW